MKPSFIIIGGVKCASSSLYRYLNYHPQVLPCKTKEPAYFSNRNWLRLIWGYRRYLNLFPDLTQTKAIGDWLDLGDDNKMHPSKFTKKIEAGKKYITGEATATTHTHANPRIVKLFLPKVKLILLLRDPSERFISHYNMLRRFHDEGRKGYDLEPLATFVNKEITSYKSGKKTRILSQGMYMNNLPTWKKVFGDNLRLYKTSDFSSPTANETMNDICNFLKIETNDFNPILKIKYNSTGQSIERSNAYETLREFYAPQVASLREQFGINLD